MPYVPAWQQASWRAPPPTPPAPGTPGATPAAGAAPPAQPPPDPTQQAGWMGTPGPNTSPRSMEPWANWMASGGVNPAGWQSLGGGPDLSFLGNFQQMLGQGASPNQVAPTTASSMGSAMQPYEDMAYQQSMRDIAPQQQQQTAAFQQQMINQGIAPGSAAYQQAQDQLQRGQNDQTAQARAQAMQQGLAAQGQAFGQGLQQSQLSSQLAQALLGAQTGISNQQLGGNASIMNQLLGGNSGIAQQLIGGQFGLQGANASAGASRYGSQMQHDLGMSQLAQTGQQQDWNNLMQLIGVGTGGAAFNNGVQNQNQQNAMGFMPFMPNGGGGQIDVTGPYNQQYGGQMNQWGYNNQQANATNQAAMQAFEMALLCDRDAKETIKTFDVSCEEVLRSLPIDLWIYKHDPDKQVHVGTYAQDFNSRLGLGDNKTISIVDMLGFMLKVLQEQAGRLDRLEAARA